MWTLLRHVSWPELRHHPWRHAVAWLAVVLGVALAFSVHLINQSALSEFSAAVRQANGQPDFELRAQRDGFDEALYARVANHASVAAASPVLEVDTQVIDANGQRLALRVVGLDALVAAPLTPALMPRPAEGVDRLALLDPGSAFLNPAAEQRLGAGGVLRWQVGAGQGQVQVQARVQGRVAADGPPLAVMDIAGAQAAFGRLGRLTRIDVRLVPGADREALLRDLQLPAGVRAAAPDEAEQRISNLSRAYRVNLTVLALVALFTGAFLVFSILSLSVAKRLPQFALLGVLGLSARERLGLVIAESALLGAAGSAGGILLGTGLAALALRLLSGDLGGAYFPGVTPRLQFSPGAAGVYAALGVAAALAGGWLPARSAQRIAPAQALKGLGVTDAGGGAAGWALALLALGAALTLAPPVAGIPLAAYLSVACLLLGGIAGVPAAIGLLLRAVAPPAHPLALLAVERARHQRHSATIAVAGVVASLALSVALTVMVASFRDAVTQWLDSVLPADLYLRSAGGGGASGEAVFLPETLATRAAALPGVTRVQPQRGTQVQIDPSRPAVALIARPLADPARSLPLLGEMVAPRAGLTSAYVSEPMARIYRLAPGQRFELPLPDGRIEPVWVRAVWRDYARQHGALLLDAADYRRLTGDARVNDLALWLAPGVDVAAVQRGLRSAAGALALEFASAGEIRALSLRIFDRSFAVTYWLQAVALAIGLFGVAASFSAQVLARRREFGLLSHLGLTRRQILTVVAAEGAVWTGAGALAGLALGVLVSGVLVKVVNPQSFHWTMDLLLPWGRLAALCAATLVAGTLTAWMAGRAAAGRDAALAVKEDW